jgi:hypothetical protein
MTEIPTTLQIMDGSNTENDMEDDTGLAAMLAPPPQTGQYSRRLERLVLIVLLFILAILLGIVAAGGVKKQV